MKLQTKLIVAFSGIVILMSLLQSYFFQNSIENNFEDYIRENENESIVFWQELLIDYYQYSNTFKNVQEDVLYIANLKTRRGFLGGSNMLMQMLGGLKIAVVNSEGIIVGDTELEWLGRPAKDLPGIREDLLLNGEKIGQLIINKEKSAEIISIERRFIESVNKTVLFSAALSVIAAAILGIVISRKMTKPLEKLMTGTQQLARGDTSYRVKVNSKDEFSQLAASFNEMSEMLKKNEDVRRSLMADIAHELRTPLAILRGKLDSIQEGALELNQGVIVQLNDEAYRLTKLVNELQLLSLAEAGKLPLDIRLVNLNELVKKIIFNFDWLAEEKKITIQFSAEDEINIKLDADRITQVIVNLLGNALRHTPISGKVSIDVAYNQLRSNVLIKMKDSGIGIEEEHLPYIFERFYRTDASRSRDQGGTGLGLAIAKGYVEAHGGTISVLSKKNSGTTFIIYLPIN